MDENRTLKAKDFQDIKLEKAGYYCESGYNEFTLKCQVRGKAAELKYTVYRHDEGYGFTIHSDGTDIWEAMPEPELEKLEDVLSNAVVFGEWIKRLEGAKTKEAVDLIRAWEKTAGRHMEIESSGGITIDTLRDYAIQGVDFVSVGALTHSYKSLDMSFKAVK